MTIQITPEMLRAIGPCGAHADAYAGPLTIACARFDISTAQRMAAFLGQILEESGALSATVENLNYSAERLRIVWPGRFDSVALAADYAHQPEKLANFVYGGRMGNGPQVSGDGWKFRGRGLIQLTGRDAYARCAAALNRSLIASPDLLEQPINSALSAAWFWADTGCNALADKDAEHLITLKLNGGTVNEAVRIQYWRAARKALGLAQMPTLTMTISGGKADQSS